MSQSDPATYAAVIQHHYPQLTIHTAQLNQEGQYNDILVVNNEWIFRFPKFAEGIATLQREVAILGAIRQEITLPIPNPNFLHLATATIGEAFMGYRLLPGRSLRQEEFQRINDPIALERMAHQLAGFLRELHTIPTVQFHEMNLPVADQADEWHDLYARIRSRLFPLMRAEARGQVASHFEQYLAHPEFYGFTLVLRHGDFGTSNLLYDAERLSIIGVIDFGATTLGDPAIDFAGLLSFGEAFCRHCFAVYPLLTGMRDRVDFYRGTFALQEALYGVESGDAEAFARGIEGYQ